MCFFNKRRDFNLWGSLDCVFVVIDVDELVVIWVHPFVIFTYE